MPQTTDVPYDTTPDPAFVAGVVAFPWQPWVSQGVQMGWVASGDCPRCHHTMAVYRRRVGGSCHLGPSASRATARRTIRTDPRTSGRGADSSAPWSHASGPCPGTEDGSSTALPPPPDQDARDEAVGAVHHLLRWQ